MQDYEKYASFYNHIRGRDRVVKGLNIRITVQIQLLRTFFLTHSKHFSFFLAVSIRTSNLVTACADSKECRKISDLRFGIYLFTRGIPSTAFCKPDKCKVCILH